MALETISEPAFLRTELRYTLGQLHVQALDLDEEARREARCDGRSIEDILQDMVRYEQEYQSRYRNLLHAPPETGQIEAESVQLPVSEAEQAAGTEHDFEQQRARTIAMLDGVTEPWP